MADRDSDDSDAPEEYTAQQAIELDEEIQKVQKENKSRVARERKERQRQWAQRRTPQPSKDKKEKKKPESHQDEEELNEDNGMLPKNIVDLMASREKQVFFSDSEEENTEKKAAMKKKKRKNLGVEAVIINEIPHAQCLEKSLQFLKKKKMEISRSTSVLDNSNQALRLISSSGLLGMK